MAIRDNMLQKFGPLLLEALVYNLLEEINTLRVQMGLPIKQFKSFLGTCNNHMDHLEDYNWLKDTPDG